MLKWAVNGPRQSCYQNEDNNLHLPFNTHEPKKCLKRRSCDVNLLRPKTSWLDKENQYTSTPLRKSISSLLESPSYKIDSLRDLSNIVPELSHNSPEGICINKEVPKSLNTPQATQTQANIPNNYTSTLPTFDVEYSPSGLIPGPVLALRGVGIPDSYFKKPRYLTPHFQDCLQNANEETPLETKTLLQPAKSILKHPTYCEESTLSSTKMGDATLERMIEAILASNRKSDKPRKHQQAQSTMSPTYTPAEDPANDLQEVWDSEKARFRQRNKKFRAKLTKKVLFNEREICSPLLVNNSAAGLLRRQRCLRRKRKINQLTASVMSSAKKLLGKEAKQQNLTTHKEPLKPPELLRNLSPDSGHNSSSDYDEAETDITIHQCITDDNKTSDNTKRRLSFNKI